MRLGFVWLPCLLVAVGCWRPAPPLFEEIQTRDTSEYPRWPAAPAEARVRYLGEIRQEGDLDPSRGGVWRRVVDFVTGAPGQRFVRPAGICTRDGMLAVADPGAGALHLLDLEARSWVSTRETGEGVLGTPVDVACLPDGEFLVSDSRHNVVWVFDREGAPAGHFTEEPLSRPTGLAFEEAAGRVWVTETLEHRVRSFDTSGRSLEVHGARGLGEGELNYPTYLAADPQGGLWVTDALNFRLQRVVSGRGLAKGFGAQGDGAGSFARPRGVEVDAAGRVLAVDALFDAVQIFRPDGQLLLVFGERGSEPGRFWLPSDLSLDGRGHVFVSDSFNERIQIFAYRPPGDAA